MQASRGERCCGSQHDLSNAVGRREAGELLASVLCLKSAQLTAQDFSDFPRAGQSFIPCNLKQQTRANATYTVALTIYFIGSSQRSLFLNE